MVEMVGNGLKRSRGILVPILWVVLHILYCLMISIFKAIVDLRNKVPNLMPVGFS